VFDEAFRLFWRKPRAIEKMLSMMSRRRRNERRRRSRAPAAARVARRCSPRRRQAAGARRKSEIEIDAADHVRPRGAAAPDFAQMSAAEIAEAKRAIAAAAAARRGEDAPLPPDRAGQAIDPRRTLRASLRTGGA
jgi:uncharacterized protein